MSAIETGYALHTRDSNIHGERSSLMTTANFIVGVGPRNAQWQGLPSIWQAEPRPFQNARSDAARNSEGHGVSDGSGSRLTHELASPNKNDSSTRLRPSNAQSTTSQREQRVTAALDAERCDASPSLVTDTPSSTRTSVPLASPAPSRNQGLPAAAASPSVGILSNASLLNGSTPHIEPQQLHRTYVTRNDMNRSQRDMETNLRDLNIARVNDFIPSKTPINSRQTVSNLRPRNGFNTSNTPFDMPRTSAITRTSSHEVGTDPAQDLGSYTLYHRPASPLESPYALARANNALIHPYDQTSVRTSVTSDIEFRQPAVVNTDASQLSTTYVPNGTTHTLAYVGSPSYERNVARGLSRYARGPGNDHFHNNETSAALQYEEYGASRYVDRQRMFDSTENTYNINKTTMGSSGSNMRNGIWTPSFTPPAGSDAYRSTNGNNSLMGPSDQVADPAFKQIEPNHYIPHGRMPPLQVRNSNPSFDYFGNSTSSSYQQIRHPGNYATSAMDSDAYSGTVPHETRGSKVTEKPISPFLRDFKLTCKTKRWELKDVYNYIVEFSGDQHGSRFIQSKLETANSDEKEQVFSEIQSDVLQLMTDIFGNYVIQKLFEHGTQAQKKMLAGYMKGRVFHLTTNTYGCRVVQKALEHVLTEQQASMMKELDGNILMIIENQNGNHVIQKAIERVPGEHIKFVMEAPRGQVVRLSKHSYGCRVVQRMLEYGQDVVVQYILAELYGSIPSLVTDQFGNYVMQHIIRNGLAPDKSRVVAVVLQQLLFFSKHKFASNVVEAAISCAEDAQRDEILRILTSSDAGGQSPVFDLIRDQYGNYVIQTVLSKLRGAALENLVRDIKQYLITLRKFSHGKQVSAMEKAIADASFALSRANHHPDDLTAASPTTMPTGIPHVSSSSPLHVMSSQHSARNGLRYS